MVKHTANLYVSVTQPRDQSDSKDQSHSYHRPARNWMISVEPHHQSHFHIPGTHREASEPVHYVATPTQKAPNNNDDNNDGDAAVKVSQTTASQNPFIGNILVAESSQTTPEAILTLLQQGLSRPDVVAHLEPSNWIPAALSILQHESLVTKFDVQEFMTFAHAYEQSRVDGEENAASMVVYPRVKRSSSGNSGVDAETKPAKGGGSEFWLSFPGTGEKNESGAERREGRDGTYGGLM